MYEFICPDKTFKMSSVYVDSDHNVGTIFQKTFGGEFMKESSLFVPFGKEIFTLVLPMIRDGTIYVPEPKQLVELAALLRFLAGENPHWEKVANLFSGSFILDPYSRLICLYSPTVVGRFLDITNAAFYEPHTDSREIELRSDIYTMAKDMGLQISFLRSSMQSVDSSDVYYYFQRDSTGNIDTRQGSIGESNRLGGMYPQMSFTVLLCRCTACANSDKKLFYNTGCTKPNEIHKGVQAREYISNVTISGDIVGLRDDIKPFTQTGILYFGQQSTVSTVWEFQKAALCDIKNQSKAIPVAIWV